MKRAVVIGGGLGGLAAGLRLRAQGWRVTICEAGPAMGGKMNRWRDRGYVFDTGPSLITMPWVFEDLFKVAGAKLGDHLELVALDPLCEYVYPGGVRFTYTPSLAEWLPTLERIAPEDKDGFLRFMHLGSRLWEVSRQTFLRRTPYDPPRRDDWKLLRDLPLRHGWGNYARTVEAHFKSPYLRQMFNRYPTYVGSSPYSSPATLAVIPYLEFAYGGYYVKGGLYRLVEVLECLLQKLGALGMTNARVTRILLGKANHGKRAAGVLLATGEEIPADVVVMNGDAATIPELLDEGSAPFEPNRSMSGLVMLLGIDRSLPQMRQHTVYFSGDYRKEFSQIFEEQRFPDDPTVYVNIPSRGDRSLVPSAEGETVFIMANAPARSAPWNDDSVGEARDRVLARLEASGFPDVRGHVIVSDTWHPRRIEERYLMPGGAIYGTNSHGWRNAFLRPRNRSSECDGLYLVGGSTHPGGGTPTVLLSAEITCALIQKHEGG